MTREPQRTTIRLKLTECQQAQIRQATGREVSTLELRLHGLPEPDRHTYGTHGGVRP